MQENMKTNKTRRMKDNACKKKKRQGKRYLAASNLRTEVLDLLPHHWCCPDASGRILPYPCINVLTDLGKQESQDVGQQGGLERVRWNQKGPSGRKQSRERWDRTTRIRS